MLGTALAVPATCLVLLGPVSATGLQQSSADDPAAAGPCDSTLPLAEENACDPADSLPSDDVAFIDAIKAAFGSRYAGKWIDRTKASAPSLLIGVRDVADSDRVALALLPQSGPRVRLVDATLSLVELNALSTVATKAMQSAPYPFMVGADVDKNRLGLSVPDEHLLEAKARVVSAIQGSTNAVVRAALERMSSMGIDVGSLIRAVGGFSGVLG